MTTSEPVSSEILDAMNSDEEPIWPTRAQDAFNVAQAQRLKEQAKAGGLRFEVFLTSDDAAWLLELVESKAFIDPSHAVWQIVQQARELHPHKDLRRELLRRMFHASADDPRPSKPIEDVRRELQERMSRPRPVPAIWEPYRHEDQEK